MLRGCSSTSTNTSAALGSMQHTVLACQGQFAHSTQDGRQKQLHQGVPLHCLVRELVQCSQQSRGSITEAHHCSTRVTGRSSADSRARAVVIMIFRHGGVHAGPWMAYACAWAPFAAATCVWHVAFLFFSFCIAFFFRAGMPRGSLNKSAGGVAKTASSASRSAEAATELSTGCRPRTVPAAKLLQALGWPTDVPGAPSSCCREQWWRQPRQNAYSLRCRTGGSACGAILLSIRQAQDCWLLFGRVSWSGILPAC